MISNYIRKKNTKMDKFYSWVFIYLFLIFINGFAQPKIVQDLSNGKIVKNYVLSKWDSRSGLPQNSVMAVQQDKNGFLWIATFDGLARFDGLNFKIYSVKDYPELKSNRLVTLHIDSKNVIWISNELGRIITFDGKVFRDVTPVFNQNFLYVYNIREDQNGMIYFRSYEHLLTYKNGKSSKVVLRENSKPNIIDSVHSINNIGGDSMLVICKSSASIVVNGVVVKSLRLEDKNLFTAIKNDEGYWLANNYELLFSRSFEGINNARRFEGMKTVVNDLFSYHNHIIATTFDYGIAKISLKGVEEFLSRAEAPSRQYSFYRDKDSNYWIGTDVYGLIFMKKKFLYTLGNAQGIIQPNTYPILKASDGTIWIGQNAGLQRIAGNKIISYTDKYGLKNSSVWGLAEDKEKNIWVGVNGYGLFKFNGKNFEDYSQYIIDKSGTYIFALLVDSKNRLWIGSVDCISKHENGQFKFYHPSANTKNIFRNFLEDDKGNIWAASDQGVFHLEGDLFKPVSSLNLKLSRALYIDSKKRLWIGSYGNGILVKDGEKTININKRNGLYSDIISAIVEDGRGNYWFTTNTGIFRITQQSIEKYFSGDKQFVTSISYGLEEGLQNTEFNGGCQPNWMRDREGNLWFPSFGGPVILDVSTQVESNYDSKLFIENLTTNDKIFWPNEEIILPSTYSRFTINFNSPSFTSGNKIQFKYKLSGIDNEWVDIGNQHSITFQKLPYGDYVFELIASDNRGNMVNKPATLKFSVRAKINETPYFYIILFFIIISIIAYAFNLKLKIAKTREEKLEKIVSERTSSLQIAKEQAEIAAMEEKSLRSKSEEENRQKNELLRIVSHDLKNPVSAIKGFTEMLLEDGELNEEDRSVVEMMQDASERLREMITQLLNFSRFEGENFTILKSEVFLKGEIAKVLARLEPVALKKNQKLIRDFQQDEVKIKVDDLLFGQIIENLVSNAIKYSAAGKDILIWMKENNGKVLIGVKDSGQGFSAKDKELMFKPFVKLSSLPTAGEQSTGLGLTIVKKFVELNDGALNLTSEKGVGSEFIINFDIVKN